MNLYDIEVKTITGRAQHLREYAGKTMLVVNVASQCGFTPQYKGLEALYRNHKDKGLVVLGFPCDQFGRQEPGNEAEIQTFCDLNYDVSFPMFAKVEVNGNGAHPLYRYLKKAAPGILSTEGIKWNFTKFLIAPQGHVVMRYAPATSPSTIESDLTAFLR